MDIGAAAKGGGFGASSFHWAVCAHLRNNSLIWNEAPNQFPFAKTPIIDRHPHASNRGERQQMRADMCGNEDTAKGGVLGTSGLQPQRFQNAHKHPSSMTEVLAAFHLAARGDSGWWFRQTAWGAHGHSPGRLWLRDSYGVNSLLHPARWK